MKHLMFAFGIITGIVFNLNGQTIELKFPYFAGTTYAWYLIQGDKQDTIVKDIIPRDGFVKLTVPERHKGYVGISRWILTSKEGGGMDLILNGKDYQVICLEPAPSRENIQFIGTRENPFLNEQYYIQKQILMKAEAIQMALNSYSESDTLFPVFIKEKENLNKTFAENQAAVAQSPLYAARFRQIVDFTQGVADKFYDSDNERALALDRFVTEQMDWGALYTSGHWNGVISNWIDMHIYAIQDDEILLKGTRKILGRLDDKMRYTDFAIQLVRGFTKYSKDDLILELTPEISQSGKLLHMNGALMVFAGLHKGDKAAMPSGLTNTKNFYKNGAVIFFYESDCGNCTQVKKHLIMDYPVLSKYGIRVISISADTDSTKNSSTLQELPWPDKISDYLNGANGENYLTWGVLGTPTLFLVDKTGTVIGRYVSLTLEDILKELGIKN